MGYYTFGLHQSRVIAIKLVISISGWFTDLLLLHEYFSSRHLAFLMIYVNFNKSFNLYVGNSLILFYSYCFCFIFYWSFVVFDWVGIDIVFTLFVIHSKEGFWTSRDINGFLKKVILIKFLFHICYKNIKDHIYIQIYDMCI